MSSPCALQGVLKGSWIDLHRQPCGVSQGIPPRTLPAFPEPSSQRREVLVVDRLRRLGSGVVGLGVARLRLSEQMIRQTRSDRDALCRDVGKMTSE
jgi:hypothetical protein